MNWRNLSFEVEDNYINVSYDDSEASCGENRTNILRYGSMTLKEAIMFNKQLETNIEALRKQVTIYVPLKQESGQERVLAFSPSQAKEVMKNLTEQFIELGIDNDR